MQPSLDVMLEQFNRADAMQRRNESGFPYISLLGSKLGNKLANTPISRPIFASTQ